MKRATAKLPREVSDKNEYIVFPIINVTSNEKQNEVVLGILCTYWLLFSELSNDQSPVVQVEDFNQYVYKIETNKKPYSSMKFGQKI